MKLAIGIDLGSTSSHAAVAIPGPTGVEVHLLSPPEGIPSVVTLSEDGQRSAGSLAREAARSDPLSAVWGSKRLTAQRLGVIDQVRQLFTYQVEPGEREGLLLKVGSNVVSLHEVTSDLVEEVLRVARERLDQPVEGVVVTVPSYFSARQREAIERAVESTGVELLELLNEPTATGLAWAHDLARRGEELEKAPQRPLIFDLGGGTLDIAILELRGDEIEVIAAGGDTFLGGVDFDDALERMISSGSSVVSRVGHRELSTLDRARIRRQAERVKIALSTDESAMLHVTAISHPGVEDGSVNFDITERVERGRLERQVEPLIERAVEVLGKVVERSAIAPEVLLLVGGQAKMPLLRRRVLEATGLELTPEISEMHSVVRGAAIRASRICRERHEESARDLSERLNGAVGVLVPGGALHPIFPDGEPLPARRELQLTTSSDGQRTIELTLGQDLSDLQELGGLQELGRLSLGGLPELPAGEAVIDVEFNLSLNGTLRVRVPDPTTGLRSEVSLSAHIVPREELVTTTPTIHPPREPAPVNADDYETLEERLPTEEVEVARFRPRSVEEFVESVLGDAGDVEELEEELASEEATNEETNEGSDEQAIEETLEETLEEIEESPLEEPEAELEPLEPGDLEESPAEEDPADEPNEEHEPQESSEETEAAPEATHKAEEEPTAPPPLTLKIPAPIGGVVHPPAEEPPAVETPAPAPSTITDTEEIDAEELLEQDESDAPTVEGISLEDWFSEGESGDLPIGVAGDELGPRELTDEVELTDANLPDDMHTELGLRRSHNALVPGAPSSSSAPPPISISAGAPSWESDPLADERDLLPFDPGPSRPFAQPPSKPAGSWLGRLLRGIFGE